MHDKFCDGRYGLKCICKLLAAVREDERQLTIHRINKYRLPSEPNNSTWNQILNLVESKIRSGKYDTDTKLSTDLSTNVNKDTYIKNNNHTIEYEKENSE